MLVRNLFMKGIIDWHTMSAQTIPSSKCRSCQRVIVPPRGTCPYCGLSAGVMEKLSLSPQGTILSFTTLHMPPDGFQAPLSMALVELEQGALILCLAIDQTKAAVSIGDSVSIELDAEGRFRYRPEK
jgi:uncharacterized OB-fold protein